MTRLEAKRIAHYIASVYVNESAPIEEHIGIFGYSEDMEATRMICDAFERIHNDLRNKAGDVAKRHNVGQ